MSNITRTALRRARRKYGVKVIGRVRWSKGLRSLSVYQWRRKNRPHFLLPNKPADTLWAHITVTSVRDAQGNRKSMAQIARELHDIGVDRFGTGISYNFLIHHETGEIALGQALDAAGAHTINDKGIPNYSYNQNKVSLAIAVVGMPGCRLSEVALDRYAGLVAGLIDAGALTEGHDFNPHRMVAYKECPTDNIVNQMPEITTRVKCFREIKSK